MERVKGFAGITNKGDGNKVFVSCNAFQNVESIQSPTVGQIEDLGKHKYVEHKGLQNSSIVFVDARIASMRIDTKYPPSQEMKHKDDNDLIYRLEEDLLIHVHCKQRNRLFPVVSDQKSLTSRVGDQCQGSECVHNDADPEKLHGRECRSSFL